MRIRVKNTSPAPRSLPLDTAGRIDRFNKRFAGNITGAKRKTRKAVPAKAEEEA